MRHGIPQRLTHFFTSTPLPCPYLPGRTERKLVAEVAGPGAGQLYASLSKAGFRRSHGIAYAPACPTCAACLPARIVVDGFHRSRSLRRVANRNADITMAKAPPRATAEQYDLFATYVRSRHGDGDMARMDERDYRYLVQETAVDTAVAEFRDGDGVLVGACLIDRLDDGVSAVYSFFDPAQDRRGLGNLMILRLVEHAADLGLPYVYLGFWIAQSGKMAYKARFQPLELFIGGEWRRHADLSDEACRRGTLS